MPDAAGPGAAAPRAAAPAAAGTSATAALAPTTGSSTSGTVRFAQRGDKVLVTGEVRGLRPNVEHGFHVHEKGDCSSGDGMSAGGHFNPGNQPHGRHAGAAHHAGDLPSLRADASGVARFSFESAGISVGPGRADVVGKGLIVHRDPDDYTTQPTGNAGPRLACAVIVRG
ncbi:MAG TPA: superoxide dismutase family protein [Ramlibacter sp.]|nr:superoxide dismutase family protein [Ramlibacter sp.]